MRFGNRENKEEIKVIIKVRKEKKQKKSKNKNWVNGNEMQKCQKFIKP